MKISSIAFAEETLMALSRKTQDRIEEAKEQGHAYLIEELIRIRVYIEQEIQEIRKDKKENE